MNPDSRTAFAPRRAAARVLLVAVVVAVAGASLAWLWAGSRATERTATAVVLIHPLTGNAFSPAGNGDNLLNLETEAHVVRSDAVAERVVDRLGLTTTPAELLGQITVVVPPNTQVIEIGVRDLDPELAAAIADEVAATYLQFRKARAEAALFEVTSRIKELIADREEEREQVIAALEAAPLARRALEQVRVDDLTDNIGSLRDQLALNQATSLDPGQIVTPAAAQPPGLLDRAPVLAAIGALAGVPVLLVGGAALRRRVAAVVSSVQDLQDAGIDPPAICGTAVLPLDPAGALVAAVRSAVSTPGSGVVVLGAPHGGRKSGLRPALTDALVRARFHVLVVDLADPAHGDALAELLSDASTPEDVIAPSGALVDSLFPARGRAQSRPSAEDLVASAGMGRVVAELAKRADLVLVDAGRLLDPLGRAVLRHADNVVLETHAGRTACADVAAVVDALGALGSTVTASVVLRPASGTAR